MANLPQLRMRLAQLGEYAPELALPAGYTLREYQDSDAELLAAMMQRAFPEMTWTTKQVAEWLVTPPEVEKTFVIEQSGEVVATASCLINFEKFPETGYVHWVGADPAHSGKKLGLLVTEAALRAFAQSGCKCAVLETDDFRLPAISVYLRMGFVPDKWHESHPERWEKILAVMNKP